MNDSSVTEGRWAMSDITITYSNTVSSDVGKYVSAQKENSYAQSQTGKTVNDSNELKKENNVSAITDKKTEDVENTKKTEQMQSDKKVSKAVQEINEKRIKERTEALNRQYIGLNFSIDKETESTVVKVTDMNTKKLVRQIPSEEFLKMSERLDDLQAKTGLSQDDKKSMAKGIIFDENA